MNFAAGTAALVVAAFEFPLPSFGRKRLPRQSQNRCLPKQPLRRWPAAGNRCRLWRQNSTANIGWNKPPEWSGGTVPQHASVPGRGNEWVEDHGQKWRGIAQWSGRHVRRLAIADRPAVPDPVYVVKARSNCTVRQPVVSSSASIAWSGEPLDGGDHVRHSWSLRRYHAFGKVFLLPVIVARPRFRRFPYIGQKRCTTFVGPLLAFGLIVMFFVYLEGQFHGATSHGCRDFGGMLSGKEIPSGRSNGGKVWFWLGTPIPGTVICVSGLLFCSRTGTPAANWMRYSANIFHLVAAVIFARLRRFPRIFTWGGYRGCF